MINALINEIHEQFFADFVEWACIDTTCNKTLVTNSAAYLQPDYNYMIIGVQYASTAI